MPAGPVLLIHGGAGHRPDPKRLARIRQHLNCICEHAYEFLATHGALETVVFAVQQLEDDPLFNAGTGSVLQRDGRARMSASVMDGASGRFSAVLNIERVKNPILIATALLTEHDRILAGSGAIRFARSLGVPTWDPVTPDRRRQWRQRQQGSHLPAPQMLRSDSQSKAERLGQAGGTVGAVALDPAGRLAAATSTGGRGFEHPGRVSDSGLPVGNYANAQTAISCTGTGEDIVDEGLAIRIAQRTADGMALTYAFARTFRELARHHRRAAAIGVDCRGRITWGKTTPMLFAIAQTPTRRVEIF